ncbi:MAG: hypothetical protein HXX15_22480 [Rhodopseudomonas sp.]|nr:hypothetical protein [Rhodopseudomonas sp.]
MPTRSHAQWWSSRAPVDFEDCVETAEKTATSKEARSPLLAQCDAKFAGRRKPGGGYTYFDFMQNRHFDIAGPNPSAEELRRMDEHYTAFLDQRKKSIIAAAFAAKQQQVQTEANVALEQKQARPHKPRAQPKQVGCRADTLSCNWSRFAAGIKSFKRTLLGPPARITNRI